MVMTCDYMAAAESSVCCSTMTVCAVCKAYTASESGLLQQGVDFCCVRAAHAV